MKRSLRILCLALALLLCGGLLAACNKSGNTDESSDGNTSGTTSESLASEFTDENGNYIAQTSGEKYNGRTITFLVCTVNETYNSELVYNDYANPGPTLKRYVARSRGSASPMLKRTSHISVVLDQKK